MITSFSYTNFKSLRDVTIELEPLTVLVGPNGVGKSTALQGIRLLTSAVAKENADRFVSARLHLFAKAEGTTLDALRTRPNADHFTLGLRTTGGQSMHIAWEHTSAPDTTGAWMHIGAPDGVVPPDYHEWLRDAPEHSTIEQLSITTLRLESIHLAAPSIAASMTPTLSEQGDNLSTVLQHLAAARDGRIESIESGLQKLVNGFKRLHTFHSEISTPKLDINSGKYNNDLFVPNIVAGFRLELEFDGIGRIPADHVSEGTLLALGLLTALHLDDTNLVLMDDVDRALHPAAQQMMIQLFKGILAQRPELQLIMTTHSPDLVNACDPSQIRVFGTTPEGVAVRRLDAHPEAAHWMKLLRGGEFWSTVGEDWVGGVPATRQG